jgi:uncharacterized linocin/CFP29 family protein
MCKPTAALSETIGQENTQNLVDMITRAIGRAVERGSQQTVEIVINEKGFVRHINGSDNVNGIRPKVYQAE